MKLTKKLLCILFALVISASVCGCANTQNPTAQSSETTQEETASVSNLPDTDKLEWTDYKEYNLDAQQPVKNVILMIGDGMGENIIKASEIVKGDKLVMQGIDNTVYVKTDSLSGTTDSAAASTAMSCGIKTLNSYLGVDENGNPAETMCEFAKAKGMKTGLAVTQVMPHATPAGMVCHYDARSVYNTLFKQMLKANVDVLFGGGSEYYRGSVEKEAQSNNYQYISDEQEMNNLSKDNKVLGLFAYQGIFGEKTPSLATMSEKALELLDNDNGFFLMIEGSNIDIEEADLDMEGALKEMQSFDKTVSTVLSWAEKHPGTLVIVTADHETGGVTLPKNAKAEDINSDCFTSGGEHTGTNVLLMTAGAQSDKLFESDVIENTDISKAIRCQLDLTYGEKEPVILNDANR